MLSEINRRISELEQRLQKIVRIGRVTSLLPDRGMVRVKTADADELVTYELPVLFPKTSQDKYYRMPDVDEPVLCVFLPIGIEQGFVLGAYYSDADPVPEGAGKEMTHVEFSNGTKITHNRETGDIDVEAPGKITVAGAGTVEIVGAEGAEVKGVLQGDCICAYTGQPHIMTSANVKASV